MTVDTTAPPTAPGQIVLNVTPPKPPRATPGSSDPGQRKPVTTLTVPARPAAVTAANLATIAGTSAAAAGPVGWAVLASAGVAAGGVAVARKVRMRRGAARAVSLGAGPRITGRAAHRAGAPGTARTPGAGADRAGSRGAARPGTPAAGGTGVPRGPGTRGSAAPRTGSSSPGRGAPGGRSTGGGNGGTAARRAPATGVGRAARVAAVGGGKALRYTGRGIGHAARGTRRGWDALRRWLHNLEQPPAARPDPTVGDTVRRPPNQDTSTQGDKPMVKTTPSADGPLFQAARRFHETAANTLPKGNLELRNEAYELPAALAQIADGIRIRVNVCTQSAIHPDYSTALQQIAAVIDTAANAARQLGPAFDDLHQDLVRRLLAPAPGEEKWDVANNR